MTPTLCIMAFSRRECSKSWLAQDGRWDGWNTRLSNATYLQVLPTGSGCPPFFLQVGGTREKQVIEHPFPFLFLFSMQPTACQGPAALPGSWLQLGWKA